MRGNIAFLFYTTLACLAAGIIAGAGIRFHLFLQHWHP
jgi:hypothetical protein